jgi:long-chain acyl-CoA synthetase
VQNPAFPKRGAHLEKGETLHGMFFEQADRFADDPLLHARIDGGWRTLTWADAADKAKRLAAALVGLGIKPGDRVALISENRPEWPIAELGILSAGAIAVPAYTTNTVDDHAHILTDSGAVAAIVSTAALATRLLPAAARAPGCRHVIAIEPVARAQALSVELHQWEDLLDKSTAADPYPGKRTDTAAIIYTSGTGGMPKGVMLPHGAILSNCTGAQHLLANARLDQEVFLSFLPLSHSYEHMAGQFLPFSIGAEIYYAIGLDGLAQDMLEARPTIMTAVPRLYEVLNARIILAVARAKPLNRLLFNRALAIGRKRIEAPDTLTLGDRLLDPLLDLLVRRKVRARFGGRLRFLVSGGAPLNYEVGIFFLALGVTILQGYGMTEAAPVISCNPPERIRIETVGPAFKGVELRIQDDGEICVRGELVMQGYWNNQDATAEVIKDGWLHTGDIGTIDDDGYLRITDRKKDIIVNSGGDNVSPQRVEGFLTLEPEIAQAMVFGDKRPHLVALLVPDEATARAWAGEQGISDGTSLAEICQNPAFHAHVGEALSRVNTSLSPIERVRRFILTDQPFTIDNSQMTPTMKLRRHVLKDVYGARLEKLYG